MNTNDILQIFKEKYDKNEYRVLGNGNDRQQTKTLEIQGAHFVVDKPWIVREPNYDYFVRELAWYDTKSLCVHDIPGDTPKQWLNCADENGNITSNYGWCIYADENYNQYNYCLNKLIEDNHTREAAMIYTRPSMVEDGFKNGMHDFMCTFAVQCFLNDVDKNKLALNYHVFMRSNDAVFGFNNDALFHKTIQQRLVKDLNKQIKDKTIVCGEMIWTAGSLHIYERHFDYLK